MNVNITIPQSWDELSDKQLLRIAKASDLKGDAYDYAIWYILNNVPKFSYRKRRNLSIATHLVPMSELKKSFAWIYGDMGREKFIQHKGFTTPLDRMFDFTIERFSYADELHNAFLETGDFEYLQNLAAVIYLKPGETFNWLLQHKRANRFRFTSKERLLAIHYCFLGCKNHLIKRFPKVYPKMVTKQKSKAKRSSFLDVALAMSGQKFGDYNKTLSTPLFTFMKEFSNSLEFQEKWKEK